ncbi:uncharacterized protein EI90DRAFT_2927531 [Cantharellus anzutake]|uniref:uncharacterized protein n=1 Tax=Cantharellus anzutake TaxID=1750568 RepID=UPI001903F6E7|nr:uncharacterized protein EI90DRAFT_2927531 [Cantharellus anzutake]KAF8327742.1 hypothetical protein EI90DRAFT_2927531 [Cantharellus anzutake]
MPRWARRLVSGTKARFEDEGKYVIELDLVYVTDRVIVMGFPAQGMEAFYRNNRHDARKFIEHRHGHDYWVFNFCPIQENSYPAEFFRGHVSRYPFPDHHAPPLAIMALATREMDVWLEGDAKRVVVLHCKAGKGRSGTLACAYLLSLGEPPKAPRLERSMSKQEWSKLRAEEMMETVAELSDDDYSVLSVQKSNQINSPSEATAISPLSIPSQGQPHEASASTSYFDNVLALHSSRRMRPRDLPNKKPHRGVTIPSQRRFLFYWSQMLSNAGPAGFWTKTYANDAPPSKDSTFVCRTPQNVRIESIRVRMEDLGGMKTTAVKVISKVLEKTMNEKLRGIEKGGGDVWVSVTRYDDHFVETLEKWERYTRSDANIGRRKPGTESLPDDSKAERSVSSIFDDAKWDNDKMVCRFGRFGLLSKSDVIEEREKDVRTFAYALRPISWSKWVEVAKKLERNSREKSDNRDEGPYDNATDDSTSTISDATGASLSQKPVSDEGFIVDASRELRVKLYMGQVPMGWFWFIPTFHMPQWTQDGSLQEAKTVIFRLKKSDIDFSLGAGAWIIDIDVSMQWVIETENTKSSLPVVEDTEATKRHGVAEKTPQTL